MKWKIKKSWILIGVLFFTSCSKMYFPEPMPVKGKTVNKLPRTMIGTYIQQNLVDSEWGTPYMEIRKINALRCIVYKRSRLNKDSLLSQVKKLNSDSTRAELKGNVLIYRSRDTVEKIQLERREEFYLTPQDTVCEIDLAKGTYIDEFPNGEPKKLVVKKLGDQYYLNVLENIGESGKNHWFVIRLEFTDAALLLNNTSIKDTAFSKNLAAYRKIAPIDSLGSNQYLSRANDQQFFELFDQEELFAHEEWRPFVNIQPGMGLVLGGVIGLLLVVSLSGYWILKRIRRIKSH